MVMPQRARLCGGRDLPPVLTAHSPLTVAARRAWAWPPARGRLGEVARLYAKW
jgi:hypothetical protein